MRSALLVALLALVAGCGPAAAAPGAPTPPPPGIAWTYLGNLPESSVPFWMACVPIPDRSYSRRVFATYPGGQWAPTITVDSSGC